jgi:hypothetical protein
MPYVGQNIFNSSLVNSRQRSIEKINEVRSGQWGRVMPEQTSAAKYFGTKQATNEILRSGQKFQGNVKDKLAEANQRSVSGFLQRKQAIDQQG